MNVEEVQIGADYYVNSPNAKGTWRAHEIRQAKNENPIIIVKKVTKKQHARTSDTRTVSPEQLTPKKKVIAKKITPKKEDKMSGINIELGEKVGELAPGMPIYKTIVNNLPNPRGRRQGYKK